MFCDRLRAARIVRGYTQQQVCDRTHLTIRTYQRYEAGATQSSLDIVTLLADFLDVSVDLLLGREHFLESKDFKSDVSLQYLPRRGNGYPKH